MPKIALIVSLLAAGTAAGVIIYMRRRCKNVAAKCGSIRGRNCCGSALCDKSTGKCGMPTGSGESNPERACRVLQPGTSWQCRTDADRMTLGKKSGPPRPSNLCELTANYRGASIPVNLYVEKQDLGVARAIGTDNGRKVSLTLMDDRNLRLVITGLGTFDYSRMSDD